MTAGGFASRAARASAPSGRPVAPRGRAAARAEGRRRRGLEGRRPGPTSSAGVASASPRRSWRPGRAADPSPGRRRARSAGRRARPPPRAAKVPEPRREEREAQPDALLRRPAADGGSVEGPAAGPGRGRAGVRDPNAPGREQAGPRGPGERGATAAADRELFELDADALRRGGRRRGADAAGRPAVVARSGTSPWVAMNRAARRPRSGSSRRLTSEIIRRRFRREVPDAAEGIDPAGLPSRARSATALTVKSRRARSSPIPPPSICARSISRRPATRATRGDASDSGTAVPKPACARCRAISNGSAWRARRRRRERIGRAGDRAPRRRRSTLRRRGLRAPRATRGDRRRRRHRREGRSESREAACEPPARDLRATFCGTAVAVGNQRECLTILRMSSESSPVAPEVVRKVAALARLRVSEADLPAWTRQLGRILSYIGQLEADRRARRSPEVPLPSTPFRADVARAGGGAAALAENAPSLVHGFGVVPRVVGGSSS